MNIKDKTQAIVLATVPINDRTQLVHLYTRTSGRVTCRMPVVSRGRKAGQLRQLMTPMTLLDLELGGRSSDHFRTIAEASICLSPYALTFSHPHKATQCIFMAELLAHTVRQEEADPLLWAFLAESLDTLGSCDQGWANFHLVFTLQLTALLGFGIDTSDYAEGLCLDLAEGTFVQPQPGPLPPQRIDAQLTQWYYRLASVSYADMHLLALDRSTRSRLLDLLLTFLALHIPEMGNLRSVGVLKDVFN